MSSSSGDGDFVLPGVPPAGLPEAGDTNSDVEFVLPGGAGGGTETSSDDVFSVPVKIDAGGGVRGRARRAVADRGSFWQVAVTSVPDASGVASHVVTGMVELQWELKPCDGGGDGGDGGSVRRGVCGNLVYTILRSMPLQQYAPLPADFNISSPMAWLRAREMVGHCLCATGETLSRFLSQDGRGRDIGLLMCSDEEAQTLHQAPHTVSPGLFRSVPIYKNWADNSRIIGGRPSPLELRRWRKKQETDARVDHSEDSDRVQAPVGQHSAHTGPFLYLPSRFLARCDLPSTTRHRFGNLGREIDPVRLVHSLGVVRHLRSPKCFVQAVDDTYAYIFQDDDSAPTVRPNRSMDPSRGTLQRTLARADVVSMLITRRLFRQWRKDGVIKCISVYSDASPVVGVELQGMLIDVVFKDDTMIRMVLPGSTLAYGHTSTVDKGVALLWALWLVAGPTADDVLWICSKVRSLTTDFGVEMHLLDMPDISEAFVVWAGGRPLRDARLLVRPDRRLFRYALRLAGWSHTLGGIMKTVGEHFPDWPSILNRLRSLCKFYKNNSYRAHIRRRLDLPPDQDKSLVHFTAGFAKWRYETIFEVLRQLVAVRPVSLVLPRELFAHAQDQVEVSSAISTCHDLPFWRFASASFVHIFTFLEYLRRWGMVCDCPEHIEERKQRQKWINCPRNCLCFSLSLSLSYLGGCETISSVQH